MSEKVQEVDMGHLKVLPLVTPLTPLYVSILSWVYKQFDQSRERC